MRNKLTVNDLPADVVERMRQEINRDRQMSRLVERRSALLAAHRYVEAMRLKRTMCEVETKVINRYLAEYEGQSESLDRLMRGMSVEDRDGLNLLTNCIVMSCDMVETFTMECNALLQKYHPDCRIEMFDKVAECGKAAGAQVRFMSRSTDLFYQYAFADDADRITELVRGEVESFIGKLKRKEEEKKGIANTPARVLEDGRDINA